MAAGNATTIARDVISCSEFGMDTVLKQREGVRPFSLVEAEQRVWLPYLRSKNEL
jgi:hypothetical protein